ncbi:methyltransferase domain-containing protein [Planctomicrobium sp. SH664]|uniref:methyltransferase domain-containing protein n=1 Tax=Planctomicrobium sp. SH664 TaxID=3448125 RepID=UPI003F5B9A0E
MSEIGGVPQSLLSAGQLQFLARKYGAAAGRLFVDVGCGDGSGLLALKQRGMNVLGMDEKQNGAQAGSDLISLGSPAASIPWGAHSVDTILFRGTSSYSAGPFSPERMIALANLGSSLKARGALVIPLAAVNDPSAAEWQSQLQTFPGEFRVRTVSTGLLEKITLAFLFRGLHSVAVAEFRVGRSPVSRLEWHRLAREAVMQRMQPPAAA